jgi:hypothetical protein
MLLQFAVHSSVRYILDRVWKNRRKPSFMPIRPVGELVHLERRTDRRTDIPELIVCLRNFSNVPNTYFVPHRQHSKSQLRLQY